MPLRNLAWLLIVPAIVCLGLAISYSALPPDKDYKLVRQIVDVLAEVDTNYVRELSDEDRQKLVEDMIDGGLRQLDPHSEYLNEAKLKRFHTDSEGSFGGVGITLGIDPKTKLLKVEHPMPGTPAYDAGLIAGDLIVKIGGEPVQPVSDTFTDLDAITDAKKRITGEVKTKVRLTIRREGRVPPEFDVELERARIEMHPVVGVTRRKDDPAKWEWFVDPQQKIALIRIQTFSELTAKELRAAVLEIKAAGGRAIVLDLRDDPGGLLNQAIEVADMFLADGKIVSTTSPEPAMVPSGRSPPRRRSSTCRATRGGRRSETVRRSSRSPATRGRWPCWSTATAPAPARSSRRRCKTTAGPSWSASGPTARGAYRNCWSCTPTRRPRSS